MSAGRTVAPSPPAPPGNRARPPALSLLARLRGSVTDVLRFAHDLRISIDDEFAGRGIRAVRLRQKISGGLRTWIGAGRRRGVRGEFPVSAGEGLGRRLPGQPECVRLVEDLELQRAQRRAGVDAEFGGQQCSRPSDRRQCVRLAAGPVERQREQRPTVFAQRLLQHQGFELADRGGVSAEGKQRGQPQFHGPGPQFVQPGDLRQHERDVLEPGVGRPPPQGESRVQCCQRAGRCTPVEQRGALVDQRAETAGVDPAGRQAQRVTGAFAHQHSTLPGGMPRLQRTPQLGDVAVEGGPARGLFRVGPGEFLQSPHAEHLVAGDQQRGEHQLLATASEWHLESVAGRGERTQNGEGEVGCDLVVWTGDRCAEHRQRGPTLASWAPGVGVPSRREPR